MNNGENIKDFFTKNENEKDIKDKMLEMFKKI